MEENIFKKGNLLSGKISGCIVECLEDADLNSGFFKGVLVDKGYSTLPIDHKSDSWGKKVFILHKELKIESVGRLFLLKNTNETIIVMKTMIDYVVLQSTDKKYKVGDILLYNDSLLEPINKDINITFKYKEDGD